MSYELVAVGFSADPVRGTGVKLRWTWPPAGFIGTLDPQFAILYIQRSTSTNPAVNSNWPLNPNFVDNVGTQLEPTPEAEWETIKIVEVPPQFMDNEVGNPWQFSNYNDEMQQPPAVTTYYRIVAFINTDPSPIYVELDWKPDFVEPAPQGPGGIWKWDKAYVLTSSSLQIFPLGCKRDGSGNTFVVGKLNSRFGNAPVVDFGGGLRSSTQAFSMFIVKYDVNGQYVWDRVISNTFECPANAIALDSAGDVIIVGSAANGLNVTSVNFGNGVVLTFPTTNTVVEDIVVAKFASSDGACQWAVSFGNTVSRNFANGVAVDGSDNIIVTGQCGNINFGGGDKGTGTYNGFVLKLDSDGAYVWDVVFPYSGSGLGIFGQGVDVDTSGDIACIGKFQGTTNFGGGNVTSSTANSGYVVKLSGTDGSLLFQKTFGEANCLGVTCISSTKDIVAVGNCRAGCNFGGSTVDTPGGVTAYAVKYDQAGAFVWQQIIGGNGDPGSSDDTAWAVGSDGSGNIYITGQIKSAMDFGDGFTFGNGLRNFFIMAVTLNKGFRWKFRTPDTFFNAFGVGKGISASAGRVSCASEFQGSTNFGGPNYLGGNSISLALINYTI